MIEPEGGGTAETVPAKDLMVVKRFGDPIFPALTSLGSIQRGPAASGVFARFSPDGRTLTLLDRDGRSTSTLAAGAGLIAATAREEDAPVWVVTGTDAAGLEHAASAFAQPTLQDRFAVAVSERGNALVTEGVPR